MSQNRVNTLLIGSDIARTTDLDISATSSQNLAEGEVFIADKNKQLLSSGSTISDSDTIYIGVGTDETFDYTDPSGSAVTGVRKIKWSNPISGKFVKNYKGLTGDSSATESKVTINIDSASSFTPVIGEEYVVRLIYKEVSEHPGQFVQEYRVIADSTTPSDLTDAFVSKINKDQEARVVASNSSNDLVITGKDVSPDDKDAIDEYRQVNFKAILKMGYSASDSSGWDDVTVTENQQPHPGNGNPKLVRDKEKHALGYEGQTNRIHFPVVGPDRMVNMDKWYDAIIIEHDNHYIAADNEYEKEAPLTTEIYIPTGAGQSTTAPSSGHDAVLNVLNPWMASLPKGFSNVSV